MPVTREQRQAFRQYLQTIEANCRSGSATERTHYPALKSLIEALDSSISVISEPERIECGAPDFLVVRDGRNVGHVEAKDAVDDGAR